MILGVSGPIRSRHQMPALAPWSMRKMPRSPADSATARILADLTGTPVLTAATVRRIHGVSPLAAHHALTELEEAGILESRAAGRGRRAYLATAVLDLITLTERRLASTRFDTRAGDPNRPVPARPSRSIPAGDPDVVPGR